MNIFTNELADRYPVLKPVVPAIDEFIGMTAACFHSGGTLFTAGNGGSAADAEHICGELLKGFKSLRRLKPDEALKFARFGADGEAMAQRLQGGLRAVSLLSHPALTSAFGNDVDGELAMAQQLWALARPGDLLLGISTGGDAGNIRKAFMAARVRGVKTVLLTGNRHGRCEALADLVVAVPESETFKVQELHLPIYHAVCLAVEQEFFPC